MLQVHQDEHQPFSVLEIDHTLGQKGRFLICEFSQVCKHLGGSSCMVKNEGTGRKMTGFQRHQKIVVLMDV